MATSAERMARKRERERAAGMVAVTVIVPAEAVETIRELAAKMVEAKGQAAA